MTITALGVYSGWTMRCADTVACRWFEGEKSQETVFDVALLDKVASRGAPQRVRLHQPPHRLDEQQHSGRLSHTRQPARTAYKTWSKASPRAALSPTVMRLVMDFADLHDSYDRHLVDVRDELDEAEAAPEETPACQSNCRHSNQLSTHTKQWKKPARRFSMPCLIGVQALT